MISERVEFVRDNCDLEALPPTVSEHFGNSAIRGSSANVAFQQFCRILLFSSTLEEWGFRFPGASAEEVTPSPKPEEKEPETPAKKPEEKKPEEPQATPKKKETPQETSGKTGEEKKPEGASGTNSEATLAKSIEGAFQASLVFKAPSANASGCLALVPSEKHEGSKRVPPKTLLALFTAGKVTAATSGLAWCFTKPKKDVVFDHKAMVARPLDEMISTAKATGVARHAPATFAAGSAPATLTGPTTPPRFVPQDPVVSAVIEYVGGMANVQVGYAVKTKAEAKAIDIVPVGIALWTKKQLFLKGRGGLFDIHYAL